MKKLLFSLALLSLTGVNAYTNTDLINSGSNYNVPKGSYLSSCGECSFDPENKYLNCDCKDSSGNYYEKKAVKVPEEYKDITNDQGQLKIKR